MRKDEHAVKRCHTVLIIDPAIPEFW